MGEGDLDAGVGKLAVNLAVQLVDNETAHDGLVDPAQ